MAADDPGSRDHDRLLGREHHGQAERAQSWRHRRRRHRQRVFHRRGSERRGGTSAARGCSGLVARGVTKAKWPDTMSTSDRVEDARAKMPRIVEQVVDLFPLSEANRIIVYSDQLAKQVPRSHAAKAF